MAALSASAAVRIDFFIIFLFLVLNVGKSTNYFAHKQELCAFCEKSLRTWLSLQLPHPSYVATRKIHFTLINTYFMASAFWFKSHSKQIDVPKDFTSIAK